MVSTRRTKKPRQDAPEDVIPGNGGDDYDAEEESLGPPKARRPKPRASGKEASKEKGKQRRGRRNAGRLSKLPDMSLDILYEIFSLVDPVDLLRMSRASKALRAVLTSKSSRQVWTAAFNNIPEYRRPPPCPKDLTEIAYANLLYDPCCMGCGAPRAPPYWEALVRVCAGCIENWLTVAGGGRAQVVQDLSRGEIRALIQVLPTVYVKIPPLPKLIYVFTKDLTQLTEDLEATDDASTVVKRYEDALIAKSQFACALERVQEIEKINRETVLMAARDRRIDQILERLAHQGWREEIMSHEEDYVESISQLKGVNVARPLTEKAWGEMEARVLEAMQTCKKELEDTAMKIRCFSRVKKMRTIVQGFQQTLGPHDFCPRTEDVCQIPDIRKVIIDGTDEEFDLCAKGVISALPELTPRILEERTTKISALLPWNEPSGNALSLATAWFDCGSKCSPYPMHGTAVLRHHCQLPWNPSYREPIGGVTFDIILGQDWCAGASKFTFSKVASTIAQDLILECGEDPGSITLAEINLKLHRFVSRREDQLVVLNWQETFNYESRTASADQRFLGPDEYPEFVHDPGAYDGTPRWKCLHCRHDGSQTLRIRSPVTLPTIKQHITDRHGVDAPTENVDYYYLHRHRPPKFVRVNQEPLPANLPPL